MICSQEVVSTNNSNTVVSLCRLFEMLLTEPVKQNPGDKNLRTWIMVYYILYYIIFNIILYGLIHVSFQIILSSCLFVFAVVFSSILLCHLPSLLL